MKTVLYVICICILAGGLAALLLGRHEERPAADECISVARPAKIKPDYAGVVIPPNIAPLNFVVLEQGTKYQVRIQGH